LHFFVNIFQKGISQQVTVSDISKNKHKQTEGQHRKRREMRLSTSGHLFRERLPGEMTAPGEPTHRGIAPAARTIKGDRLVVDHVDSMYRQSASSFYISICQLSNVEMTMFSVERSLPVGGILIRNFMF
jgi:hypothetical protein